MQKISNQPTDSKSAEIEHWLANHVTEVASYLDSLWLLFPYLPAGTRSIVEATHGRRIIIEPWVFGGSVVGVRLGVHQPSPATLHVLDRLQQQTKAILYRADVSIDWIARTQEDATWLKTWLTNCTMLRWRRAGPMRDIGDEREITYWVDWKLRNQQGKRRAARDLMAYADKPSKITGAPCCHLELRLQKARACHSQRLYRATDCIRLNPYKLFDKHLRLSDGGSAYLRHAIRQEVKKDRLHHLATRHQPRSDVEMRIEDLCRAGVADYVERVLDASHHIRAQRLKDESPQWVEKTLPIQLLHIPNSLTWNKPVTAAAMTISTPIPPFSKNIRNISTPSFPSQYHQPLTRMT